MTISMDVISAGFGILFALGFWINRSQKKVQYPFGDMITVFFIGVLVPIPFYYFFQAFSIDITNYVVFGIFNPVYQVLIALVLIRYLVDFIGAETKMGRNTDEAVVKKEEKKEPPKTQTAKKTDTFMPWSPYDDPYGLGQVIPPLFPPKKKSD